MDAAKVADAVLKRCDRIMLHQLLKSEQDIIRHLIIEEIGKEVVAEACACVRHWRHDKS